MLFQLSLLIMMIQVPDKSEIFTFQPDTFFDLSPEMEEFLDNNVMHFANDYTKYNTLLTTLFDQDGLNMVYSNLGTTPPRETFSLRSGNCLSFTGMFIAMARYCGFDAQFQEVADLSRWTKKGEFTVYSRHMICSIMLDGRRKEIDFNYNRKQKYQFTSLVSDQRGIAHYYNNLGAEELSYGNYDSAISHMEKAIETDPTFSYGWTNLGIIHRIKGHFKLAEDCYRKASELNRLDQTPILNLAILYKVMGKEREAKRLFKKIRKFQAMNPYHHYELGRNAFNQGQYDEAVTHLKRAVKLHNTHPKFTLSLAAAYEKAGKPKKAANIIKRAKKQANTYDEKALYDKKLQLFAGSTSQKH